MNNNCFFCDVVNGGLDTRGIRKEILLETRNHIVVPEAHNMIDNTVYTLTISKDHKKSMQDLSHKQIEEQKKIENLLRYKILNLTGKKTISFEHGSDGAKSVDHAHVHDVGNDGFSSKIDNEILTENEIGNLIDGTYLYYRNQNNIAVYLPLYRDLPSQYMRTKLWEQIGGAGDFYTECNWKNATPEMSKRFLKNEQFTIDVLKGSFTDHDKAMFGL